MGSAAEGLGGGEWEGLDHWMLRTSRAHRPRMRVYALVWGMACTHSLLLQSKTHCAPVAPPLPCHGSCAGDCEEHQVRLTALVGHARGAVQQFQSRGRGLGGWVAAVQCRGAEVGGRDGEGKGVQGGRQPAAAAFPLLRWGLLFPGQELNTQACSLAVAMHALAPAPTPTPSHVGVDPASPP